MSLSQDSPSFAFNVGQSSSGVNLISDEDIVGWNPDLWVSRANNIEKIYGRDSLILITIRDPKTYLRSVYQQLVQQGCILSPEKYFLNDESYSNAKKISRWSLNEIFKVDSFDYERLIDIYRSKFDTVIVVGLEHLSDLEFLSLLPLNKQIDCHSFVKGVNSSDTTNRSYSVLAMKLTFLRENLLNKIGLRSMSSCDRYLNYDNFLSDERIIKFSDYSFSQKVRYFPRRIIRKYFTWRGFLQNILDRVFIYKSYKLPESIYLGAMYSQNVKFHSSINSCLFGAKVYKS